MCQPDRTILSYPDDAPWAMHPTCDDLPPEPEPAPAPVPCHLCGGPSWDGLHDQCIIEAEAEWRERHGENHEPEEGP